MSIKRFLGSAVTASFLAMGGVAAAQPTFSILGPGTTAVAPYEIEDAPLNHEPPWGILQNPAETIYCSGANNCNNSATATQLFLTAPSNVRFQYFGKGDAAFVSEFKVLDAGNNPLLIWCTQGASVVNCPAAAVNAGFESGPTAQFVGSTTVELSNLPAGLLNFRFIGNIAAEGGPPGPGSGAVSNTDGSNVCPSSNPSVCFGIAVPGSAGRTGLSAVKLGFKDGGRAVDPDFQDMVIQVTISSPAAVPSISPQGMLALVLLLGAAAAWRLRASHRAHWETRAADH